MLLSASVIDLISCIFLKLLFNGSQLLGSVTNTHFSLVIESSRWYITGYLDQHFWHFFITTCLYRTRSYYLFIKEYVEKYISFVNKFCFTFDK